MDLLDEIIELGDNVELEEIKETMKDALDDVFDTYREENL